MLKINNTIKGYLLENDKIENTNLSEKKNNKGKKRKKFLFAIAKWLLRKIYIKELKINFLYGDNEASISALKISLYTLILENVLKVFKHNGHLKKYNIITLPSYNDKRININVIAKIKIA